MRATKVNAGLAESNGRLLLGIWRDSLHVTCRLTACTPGSAPGSTLGNEYGKTLPYLFSQQPSDILAAADDLKAHEGSAADSCQTAIGSVSVQHVNGQRQC